ncbi:MAG: PQQ-binding-like beta-propeller repeat protein [Kiritimatiellia bacterium]|jgi:outer membrane protein assembly factor BamB|nr:PQQ-binding-like beta-propeller repeat protein [Kiritimatiellia bacterium]
MKHLLILASIIAATHLQAGVIGDSGVKGGLVVIVGCEDTKVITEFAQHKPFLVQALDTDPVKVENARAAIRESGNYGRLSAVLFDGKNLPYADNLVNAVVSGTGFQLTEKEIMRVLAPRGISVIKGKKTTKPVPDDIAEWSHYLYDSKNNAASNDKKVCTPTSLQWDSGPRWSRHHDHMSSVSAVVSAGGRIFSILDEGPRASIQYPPEWQLVARDAFNGTLLWKRPISEWHTDLWPAKAGPAQLPRRLVAIADPSTGSGQARVFVTLGLHTPVTMLDAATGETLKTFEGTEHTEEIIVSDGQLYVTAHAKTPPEGKWKLDTVQCWTEARRSNATRPWKWEMSDPKRIIAVDIASGKVLWSKDTTVAPITLGADKQRVIYHSGMNVVCLDRESGKEVWTSQDPAGVKVLVKSAPNLVIYNDVVLFSAGPGKISSISIKDGKTLWSDFHGPTGHQSSFDLLVVDGLVWSTSARGRRPKKNSGKGPKVVNKPPWTYFGRDPVTGETKREFPPGKSDWFHHRCHRGRATDQFLIMSRTGIEYVDVKTGKWQPNPWVRGACLYGMMPANGLSYAPPHPCACYIESKLNGFNALVGANPETRPTGESLPRLETGPAYKKVTALSPKSSGNDGWHTYRSDNMRSGASQTELAAKLKAGWKTKLGGKLSAVTVANGKLFIAAVDKHTVYALDSKTGDVAWEYTAGGRVDTPPTIAGGLCIFGSRDGWIYSLAAADGRLAWRYRAVARERTIVSYDQLESTWPVSGAVLVQGGSVYCVAGRSMFLDGGLHLLKLDATTGEMQLEEIMGDTIPEQGKPLHTTAGGLDMPVALPDILSSDGKQLYMRSQAIGLDGKRTNLRASGAMDQGGEDAHLVCSSGYLDDTWFHRAYWVFGRGYGTGHNGWFRAGRFAPAGRMLVFNEESVFGYGRQPRMYVWSSANEYQLYSAKREITPEAIGRVQATNRKQEGTHGHIITFDRKAYGKYPLKEISAIEFDWRRENPPLQARAMVLTDDKLFVAGPPDVVDEEDIFGNPFDEGMKRSATEQVAALKGERGALLQAVSTKDGKAITELKLESAPVFDGMAAAEGKLFISMLDGTVSCYE